MSAELTRVRERRASASVCSELVKVESERLRMPRADASNLTSGTMRTNGAPAMGLFYRDESMDVPSLVLSFTSRWFSSKESRTCGSSPFGAIG